MESPYIMTPYIHPGISLARGTFTLLIAPSSAISGAFKNIIPRQSGSILYICGNVPVILPGISSQTTRCTVHKVISSSQILPLLERSEESVVIIEHESSWYDKDADLIRSVGQACRRRVSAGQTVFMVATRPDGWLNRFEPFAHKMTFIQEPEYSREINATTPGIRSKQRTLEGVI